MITYAILESYYRNYLQCGRRRIPAYKSFIKLYCDCLSGALNGEAQLHGVRAGGLVAVDQCLIKVQIYCLELWVLLAQLYLPLRT